MKNITIFLPDKYVELIQEICMKNNTSRSALIRQAIRERLIEEIEFKGLLSDHFLAIELTVKEREALEFYRYCIACGEEIHNSNHPFKHELSFDVMELKFCCSCYKKYEGLTLNDFPDDFLKKIQARLEKYKEIKSKFKELQKSEKRKLQSNYFTEKDFIKSRVKARKLNIVTFFNTKFVTKSRSGLYHIFGFFK